MKILASDFDGTLNHGGINDYKRQAIARWRQAGNRFGLVSGRSMEDLAPIARNERLECDFFIGNNGAVIADSNGEILDEVRCPGSVAAPLVDMLFAEGCSFVRVCTQPGYCLRPTAADCGGGETPRADLPPLPYFTQIATICANSQEAAALGQRVTAQFGDYVTPLVNNQCLDIVPRGVDKAQGLYRLARLYHVSPEQILTVGDAGNDAAMLAAFRSYAMQNGDPVILALADAVTPGVAELIDRELAAT